MLMDALPDLATEVVRSQVTSPSELKIDQPPGGEKVAFSNPWVDGNVNVCKTVKVTLRVSFITRWSARLLGLKLKIFKVCEPTVEVNADKIISTLSKDAMLPLKLC